MRVNEKIFWLNFPVFFLYSELKEESEKKPQRRERSRRLRLHIKCNSCNYAIRRSRAFTAMLYVLTQLALNVEDWTIKKMKNYFDLTFMIVIDFSKSLEVCLICQMICVVDWNEFRILNLLFYSWNVNNFIFSNLGSFFKSKSFITLIVDHHLQRLWRLKSQLTQPDNKC